MSDGKSGIGLFSCKFFLKKKNDGIDVDRPGSDMEYSALFSGEVPKNTPEVVCLSLLSGELLLIRIFWCNRHRMDPNNLKLISQTSNAETQLLRQALGFPTPKGLPSSRMSACMPDSGSKDSIHLN